MNGNEHATRTSGTTDRSLTEEVEVAVVGAGPTGLTPAGMLSGYGIRTAVLDGCPGVALASGLFRSASSRGTDWGMPRSRGLTATWRAAPDQHARLLELLARALGVRRAPDFAPNVAFQFVKCNRRKAEREGSVLELLVRSSLKETGHIPPSLANPG
jgi:glycine/D-amino acid oxidase-like deaminating enzyme